jgi:hypothetical protein
MVFLVNPNPFPRPASFRIDGGIGLDSGGPFLVRELYPEERLRPGNAGLETMRGERFETDVPARTVIVFEITEPPKYSRSPLRTAGARATYDRFDDHYRLTITALQGETRDLYLELPPDEVAERAISGKEELPLTRAGKGYRLAVRFPKERVIADIGPWSVQQGSLNAGLQSNFQAGQIKGADARLPDFRSRSAAANFLGARIENLLNEPYSREVLLYFRAGPLPGAPTSLAAPAPVQPEQPLPGGAGDYQWWYTAAFPVAYVQGFLPPGPEDRNYIALYFRKPAEVEDVRVWLNGKPAVVERFHPWSAPADQFTFYVDGNRAGLKRGENEIAVFVAYRAPL